MIADLSYWYGFDVGGLSKERQLGLLANLPRVQAQQRIMDHRFESTDYETVHGLYLEAYGDEDLARRARLQALKALVRTETEAARLNRR